MARKGYLEEYKVKKLLKEKYGELNVIKVAIGGAMDYIVLKDGRIALMVEVKGEHGEKHYADARERDQVARIKRMAEEHSCRAELWVVSPRKPIEIREIHGIGDLNERSKTIEPIGDSN